MIQTSKSKMDQDKIKIKINEVSKTFFEIQFDAKKKIITRLNDEINDFKNKTEKFKDKNHRLSNKLKENYEYLKKILEEKSNLEKLLKEETTQLKQEIDSMVETGVSKLKEKDDEFIREAGQIKSITAIYAGRLNKLDEFSKQEKLLGQKYIDIKKQNVITDKNYEIALKNIEEKKYKSEEMAKRIMLKRCVDFLVHMKKQSLMVECPVEGASTKEIFDLREMLDIGHKQNAIHEQKCLDMKEENEVLKKMLKSIREMNKQKHIDGCSKKENEVSISGSKVAIANGPQATQRFDKDEETARTSHIINFDGDETEVKAADHESDATQVKLHDIRSANSAEKLLDRRIWKAEDVLLNVYEKASIRLEKMKTDTNNSEEQMIDFIQNLYKELELFITEEDKLLIQ